MKTKDGIELEIKLLKAIRPNVCPHSMFGDDNLAALDAQVEVLDEYLDSDEIYDRYDHVVSSEYILESALDARDWMDDDSREDSLANDWPLKE